MLLSGIQEKVNKPNAYISISKKALTYSVAALTHIEKYKLMIK